MSDNYATQGRKVPRTATGVGEIVQTEDAEASDGSISRKPRFRTNHRRPADEGASAKVRTLYHLLSGTKNLQVVRSHHDKPMEHIQPASFVSGSLLSKALPGLPEINLPNTSTPHNMFVHLPPRDTRTNDLPVSETGPSSNPPLEITGMSDIPIRREVVSYNHYKTLRKSF